MCKMTLQKCEMVLTPTEGLLSDEKWFRQGTRPFSNHGKSFRRRQKDFPLMKSGKCSSPNHFAILINGFVAYNSISPPCEMLPTIT